MTRRYYAFFALLSAVCLWTGAAGIRTAGSQTVNNLDEGFEAGGKNSYAADNVILNSGSWFLDDALTGNLPGDRRTGSFSARVRNTGKVRMNFDLPGAGTVSMSHAVYGTDGTSTWELWKSTDAGATWSQVGSTITTTSTTLSTAAFSVNSASAIRFEIRKVTGGTNRLNFDNIIAAASTTATPTPSLTPTPALTPTPTPSSSVHLTMGNPSNAVTDVNQPTNYLMEKAQYALSYHRDNGTPNWTSWHLDTGWLGSTSRQDDYRPDTTLPSSWYRVTSNDYSEPVYDRGHMTPSGDRTRTVADNSATFLMTNMIPQAPVNNQTTWANLENYCRTLANEGNELYIISGGTGISGYIANGRVAVPTYTWKVVMVLPSGTDDVARVTNSTSLIAVFIPNDNSVAADWRQYRVSTDYVEQLTGYDFFSNVPDSIENTIEAIIDMPPPSPTPTPTPTPTPIISGRVTYANAPTTTGVPFTTIAAAGSIPLTTMTDSNGNYSLSGFGAGAYTVTPSKTGQVNGISNLDASAVARHVAGLIVLSPDQQIAADTSGNGAVSSLDAAYIAQFIASIPNPSIIGRWKFLPESRSYPNVLTNQMNQDYSAVLVGEVTGNWNPLGAQQAVFLSAPSETSSARLVSAAGGNGARAQTFDVLSSSDRYITSVNDYLQNYRTVSFTADTDSRSPAEQNQKLPVENVQAVTVTAPLLQSVNPGSMFTVDLMASDTTGEGVLGYEFNLLYNQMVIVPGANPCDLTGTISSGREAVCNANTPGVLSVVVYGPQTLTGAGALLRLNFTAVGMAGNVSPLTFQNFLFNEGMPAAVPVNGSVVIAGAPPTVTPTPTTTPTPTPPPTPLPTPTPPRRARFDFNGDSRSDLSVFRPSSGIWYLQNSQQAGFSGLHFGLASDRLAPADFDGDGRTDIAVYRPSNGFWYLQRSAAGFTSRQFGVAEDIPQPADFDGDGRAELIVYRPSNGIWYIFNLANNNFSAFQFGAPEDKPVIGDYDGDGRADIAVFRPSNGIWYVRTSANGTITGTQFGEPNDRPVPSDYDGDGRTDIAVFRPSNGIWYIQGSTAGFTAVQFGIATDEPTPGDYDGDGRTDIAVYRASEGNWYIRRSRDGLTAMQFGTAEDRPIPNAFVRR